MKLRYQPSRSLLVVVILTLSGGFMDAYSYMCRGKVFANAQTGNMLLLGVNLSMGNFGPALRYLLPVLAFCAGTAVSIVARQLFHKRGLLHWRHVVVFVEALFLGVVAFLPQSVNLLANSMISLACGAQVEAFRKELDNDIATTMCIGNLRRAVECMAEARFTGDRAQRRNGWIYIAVLAAFVLGAVAGNALVQCWGERSILACCALLLITFISMCWSA